MRTAWVATLGILAIAGTVTYSVVDWMDGWVGRHELSGLVHAVAFAALAGLAALVRKEAGQVALALVLAGFAFTVAFDLLLVAAVETYIDIQGGLFWAGGGAVAFTGLALWPGAWRRAAGILGALSFAVGFAWAVTHMGGLTEGEWETYRLVWNWALTGVTVATAGWVVPTLRNAADRPA